MKEREFRKLVRNELKKQFSKSKKILVENDLSTAITNFYIWLMKKPIEKAKKELQDNPKLQQIAQDIKTQNVNVAHELIKDKEFLKFLLQKVKEKDQME